MIGNIDIFLVVLGYTRIRNSISGPENPRDASPDFYSHSNRIRMLEKCIYRIVFFTHTCAPYTLEGYLLVAHSAEFQDFASDKFSGALKIEIF